jgi:hypothetical protein
MNSLISSLRFRPGRSAIALAAASFAAAVAAGAPAAHAFVPGPPCDGSTCVGKTPYTVNRQAQHCADDAVDVRGSTVADLGDGIPNTVTLRWSAYCQANWARFNGPADALRTHSFYVQTYDRKQGWPYGRSYTNMVDGTQLARVCVQADNTFNAEPTCSRWF